LIPIKSEIEPIIKKDALARLLGGDKFGSIPRSTRLKIKKMEPVFEKLIEPNLCHRNMGIDSVKKGAVILEKGQEFKSTKLSKTLKNCDKIMCYIGTLGDSIEDEINRLMKEKRLSQAYILDAMASVAADKMVGMFHQQMKGVYQNQSKQVTLCFSPGYCDWPITDQKKLFGIFDSSELEVELTDSCFMKPRKSISGVFGITPPDSNPREQSYNPCSECHRRNCSARRA